MSESGDKPKFEALLEYLQRTRGFDFTGYKRPSLMRRIEKRMQLVKLEDFGDYLDYLEVHPEEFEYLFNTILINVTSFFRDEPAWDVLAREVIAGRLAKKDKYSPIRVWSAGCASGQEAYTLAMVLAEGLGPERFRQNVKIYATDVDQEALTQARQGGYSEPEMQSVPKEFREKYFETTGQRCLFRQEYRRSIIFGRHDLIQDAPMSRLDLLVSRNTLMYFNTEVQARIVARFHFALNDNGCLFLGKAEMLLTQTNQFTPLDLKCRLFTKVPSGSLRDRLLLAAQAGTPEVANHLARQTRLRELAFDGATAWAQLVADVNGNLVLANERARGLLNVRSTDIGRPIKDLELFYRPVELRPLLEQAYGERRTVTLADIERPVADGEAQFLELRLEPLRDNESNLLGISILYEDVSRYRHLQAEVQESRKTLEKDLHRSKQELQTANEELQSANEEMVTTNEELQSTVEELQTTNEELQSSNEEMETMNEELQSTNEELQTMNQELRQRTDEAMQASAFLNSIFASVDSGVVVLDRNLKILSWNHRSEDLWGLKSDEVQKQAFLSLDIGLPVDQLKGAIRACLAGDGDRHEAVLDATNRRGKPIQCRVSCTPLMDSGKERQGVILLMKDVKDEGSHAGRSN
jgi:two-component system CheB/CheR fusion protein